VNVLHELKEAFDVVGVYEWAEVVDFAERYFGNADRQLLSPILDTATLRFDVELQLSEEDKVDFKVKAKQFVKIYGQMAAIMDYEIVAWEQLFWFLKYLIPDLIVQDPDLDLLGESLESVGLSSYGKERVRLNHSIGLDASDTASWIRRAPIPAVPMTTPTMTRSTTSSTTSTSAGFRAGARHPRSSASSS